MFGRDGELHPLAVVGIRVRGDLGTMSGQDKDTAAESLQRFLEIEFWPKDKLGLTEDAVTAAIKDQVEVGNIEAGSEPAYSDIVDESVFDDAMAKVGQG